MAFGFFDVFLSSQPKPEESVIHAVAVLVLHDEFLVDEDAESASDGAGWPRLVLFQKLLTADFLYFSFMSDGLNKSQLIRS